MEDDNIDILFGVSHIQQTHIVMHEELTCYASAYGGVQIPHNQKHKEANLGRSEQLLCQSEVGEVSKRHLSWKVLD